MLIMPLIGESHTEAIDRTLPQLGTRWQPHSRPIVPADAPPVRVRRATAEDQAAWGDLGPCINWVMMEEADD